MTTSELIQKLEARLRELRAKTFEGYGVSPAVKKALETGNNLLIEEIEDRLGRLRRGEQDPYASDWQQDTPDEIGWEFCNYCGQNHDKNGCPFAVN